MILVVLPVTSARAQQNGPTLASGLSLYVTSKNYLFIQATGVFTSATFAVQYAILRAGDQTPTYFSTTNTATPLTATRNGVGFPIQLTEGQLVGVTVTLLTPSGVFTGAMYLQAFLLPSSTFTAGSVAGTAGQLAVCLIASYLSTAYSVTWPVQSASPVAGPGLNETIAVSNPSAGANFTTTFDAAKRYRVINIRFTLTTSATVANRIVCLNFTDAGGNLFATACSTLSQAASLTQVYNFSAGTGSNTPAATGTGNDLTVPLPNWIEFSDATIVASAISGIQAADTVTLTKIRVQSWQEND